jgi:hypothetical protein
MCLNMYQGRNSQNFLSQICKIFLNFQMLLQHNYSWEIIHILMICASKTTFSLNNLKILRSKVTKNLTNLLKKFCEFPPRALSVKITS